MNDNNNVSIEKVNNSNIHVYSESSVTVHESCLKLAYKSHFDSENKSVKHLLENNSHTELKQYISQRVNYTIIERGITVHENEIMVIYNSVYNDVCSRFSNLTLKDIETAFYLGVRSFLGKYYGINAVTFYEWLKEYSEKYLPLAVKKINQIGFRYSEIEQKNVSEQELDEQIISIIIYEFNKFKNSGIYSYVDAGNIAYNWLVKKNIILPLKSRAELHGKAKENLIKVRLRENNELRLRNRAILCVDINKYIQDLPSKQNEIENESKRIELNDFFNTIVKQDIDIERFLNEKLINND